MINLLKKEFGPRICSLLPSSFWHRLINIDLVLPHWHVVSDHELEHISGLYKFRSIEKFKADIEFFLKFYTPVSIENIIQHLDRIHELPKRCFLPTFDDGFREVSDIIAPFLFSKGVPAVFFIIPSVIDNKNLCYPQKKSILIRSLASKKKYTIQQEVESVLTKSGIEGSDIISRIRNIYYKKRSVLDQLGYVLECDFDEYVVTDRPYLNTIQINDLLKKGFGIGAHSIDHPLYSELTLDEQLFQTFESMKILSEKFKYKCNAFAFPYTDYGISREFFIKAFSNKELKTSFGIGSILSKHFHRNLGRFSMERTDHPAEYIIARQFGKAFLTKINL
jgi:peptidoglycan/xylan/chitin deacetylase (PgdA/CDA1 family)